MRKILTDEDKNVVEDTITAIDPYLDLLQQDGFASVSCGLTTVKQGSYGAKVSFSVHIRCDQNEGAINLAGQRAFEKAAELCNDAVNVLGWDL